MIRLLIISTSFFGALVFKIQAVYFWALGNAVLLLSGISMITNHQGFSLRLLSYSFGFFVIAFCRYILELKYEKK